MVKDIEDTGLDYLSYDGWSTGQFSLDQDLI